MMDLSTLAVPGPTRTELTTPFWDAAAKGQLILQNCQTCERSVFYPRAICPHCWSDRLVWRAASGTGRLKSFSVVHRAGHPAWNEAVPYVIGLVELAEGPTMLSQISVAQDALRVGMSLTVQFTKVGREVLPFFRAITDQQEA